MISEANLTARPAPLPGVTIVERPLVESEHQARVEGVASAGRVGDLDDGSGLDSSAPSVRAPGTRAGRA